MFAAVAVALGAGTVIGSSFSGDREPDSATAPTGGAAAETPTASGEPRDPAAQDAAVDENPYAVLARLEEGDPMALGSVDAPVVIIEYADFTCRYCGVFAVETMPTLKEYIDAGDVRFEWRDAPILSDDSVQTAIAGRAAAEQDLFWEFYDVIFAHTVDGGDYAREDLLGLAGQVDGLDLAAFETALDDPAIEQAVLMEGYETHQLGVQSTPTFIIGSEVVAGAQPIEVFQQLIDQQLTAP